MLSLRESNNYMIDCIVSKKPFFIREEHFAIITVKNMNEMLIKTHIEVTGYQVDCRLVEKIRF